jgi:hypothetical protein
LDTFSIYLQKGEKHCRIKRRPLKSPTAAVPLGRGGGLVEEGVENNVPSSGDCSNHDESFIKSMF